jgi:Flp pilus assembly protein CpaB
MPRPDRHARPWQPPGRTRRGPAPRQVVAGLGAVLLAVVSGVLAAGRERPAGPARPDERVVLVVARDLAAGAVPGAADLRQARLPADVVPADAVPANAAPANAAPGSPAGAAPGPPAGAALVVPLRRGDLLTRRDLGPGPPTLGLRGYALAIGEGVEAGPLAPGDRVDVLAASAGAATTVLTAAPVLRVVPGDQGRAALVVLGVSPRGAEALAAARAGRAITLVQAPAGPPPPGSG